MASFQDPLDAPLDTAVSSTSEGWSAFRWQLLCFPLLIGAYYSDYWHNLTVAIFGVSLLLLVELITTTFPNTPWPNFRPLGYIGALLLLLSLFLNLLVDIWRWIGWVQLLGLWSLSSYFFLWALYPMQQQYNFVWLRFAVGGVLVLLCTGMVDYFPYIQPDLWMLRATFVAALLVLVIIGGLYWVLPKEKQKVYIDQPTWQRLPQLFHLVIAIGMTYYEYGDLLLG